MATRAGGNGPQEEEAHGGAASNLRRPAFEGALLGLAAASTAITLAVNQPPPWLKSDSYFLALSGVFFAGVTQVAASVWAADGAGGRRHAAGRKLVYAMLAAPLVVAAGNALASLLQ